VTDLTNSSKDAKADAAAAVILIAIFVTAAIVWLQGLA
jgi:diacylglycerol kinase